ncbi:hypothetical protein ACGFWE_16880 [Streptomyces sp. NPDC048523]|uniref:hypothetical protein n=1 Tax=Streptomyces sp. NPDC048523 TaxID=3365567 RepID=UPI003717CE5C
MEHTAPPPDLPRSSTPGEQTENTEPKSPPGQSVGRTPPPEDQLDWFQQPERPHKDADPVRTVWQLSRFRLGSRRFAGDLQHALVLVTRKGAYRTFMPPKRPTSVWGYVALYEVDTDPHAFRLTEPLPSQVDSFEFEAVADITWRVVDPERFVRSQERDVPGLVTRRLRPVLRAAGRGHPIEASAEAEKAVQRAVDASPQLAAMEGLEVTCSVRLRRDAVERIHQNRLRTARHEEEAARPEHEATRLREQYASERTAEKLTFYKHHLDRGGTAAVALHLAVHPEDTALVLDRLHTEQAEAVKTQLQLIDRALDNKWLEGYQLEKPTDLVVERMTAILRATGTTTGTELPPPYPELPLQKRLDDGP